MPLICMGKLPIACKIKIKIEEIKEIEVIEALDNLKSFKSLTLRLGSASLTNHRSV